MTQINEELLQKWVDDNGLDAVLNALVNICYARASNYLLMEPTWKNTVNARFWEKVASHLGYAVMVTGV